MGEDVDVVSASVHPGGDVDCNGGVDPVDGLKLLRYDAGLEVQQEEGVSGDRGCSDNRLLATLLTRRNIWVPNAAIICRH